MLTPRWAQTTNYASQLRVTLQSIRDRRVSGKFWYHWEMSLSGSVYGHVTTPPTMPAQNLTLHRNLYWRSWIVCELFGIQGCLLCTLNTPLCAKHASSLHRKLRKKRSSLACWSTSHSPICIHEWIKKKCFPWIVIWIQLIFKKYSRTVEIPLRHLVTLTRSRSFQSWNCDIFTGWCPYRPWETWHEFTSASVVILLVRRRRWSGHRRLG